MFSMNYLYCKANTIEKFTCVDYSACINFRTLEVILDPKEEMSTEIISASKKRFANANLNPVDSGGERRDTSTRTYKGLLGFVAEEIVYRALLNFNEHVINVGYSQNVNIELDQSNSSKDQVDIKIIKSFKDKDSKLVEKLYTVEIRSSFPAKGLLDTTCKNFDILGPYFNETKKTEMKKDFYIRVVFDLQYDEHSDLYITYEKYGRKNINYSKTATNILKNYYFNSDFNLVKPLRFHILGGATKSMMEDDALAYDGKMETDTFSNEKGFFRKIKLNKGLDAVGIIVQILSVVHKEHEEGK